MTDQDADRSPRDPRMLDRLHPPVPATRAMPAGRIIAVSIDPAQRPWEVVLHEAEQEYTIRTPPGYDGCGADTDGLMYRTDFATVSHLTFEHGIRVPKYVAKAIDDGRVSKGWEPGTHLFGKLGKDLWALPIHTFIDKMVTDGALDGATDTPVEVAPKPWWQRAAEKLGAFVPRRAAAAAPMKPDDSAPAAEKAP